MRISPLLGVNPYWLFDESAARDAPFQSATQPEGDPQDFASDIVKIGKVHHQSPLLKRLCDLAESMSDDGVRALIDQAEFLAAKYPKTATAKRKSSA